MCKKHWYFEENLLSSAGQMWLEVAPDCLFLTYRWLESQAHIKKKSGNIKGTLTTCSIWSQSYKALRQMCNFAYAKYTPEFHSISFLAGCVWQKKGKPSAGPFFGTATINLHFQTQAFCSIYPNDMLLNLADLCETTHLNMQQIHHRKNSRCWEVVFVYFFLGNLALFYIAFCIKNKKNKIK